MRERTQLGNLIESVESLERDFNDNIELAEMAGGLVYYRLARYL